MSENNSADAAAWPYQVTIGFHTAEDRDEFLREHVERPCSDIMAPLHLIGGGAMIYVAHDSDPSQPTAT